MANRDLSNFREVTQVQPELEGQGLIMAGEIGSKIVDMSQQAKVAENLSAAQLDLAKMDNEFRIQNEANPFDKKAIETYKAQRKATLGNYRSDIGSLWAGGFDTQADNLLSNSDLQMQNWGYKQAEVNTLISLDTMGQNNKQLMMQHGLNYAKTGEGDLDTLLDFNASREQLMQFAKDSGAVGEVTAQKTLAAYDAEMAGAFLGAVTTENPYRARQLLDSGRFDSVMPTSDRIKIDKTIDREIKAANKMMISNAASNTQNQLTDPYGFYAKRGLSFSENIAAQLESGLLDIESIQVMSSKEAKGIVSGISTIRTPDEFTEFYNKLSAQYGQFTPNAIKALSSAGLNDNARLAISTLQMPQYQQDGVAFDTMFEMSQLKSADGKKVSPEQAAKDILVSQGKDPKVVLDTAQTAALQGLEKWTTAQLDGNNDLSSIATIQQQVKDMAAFYVAKGFEPKDAAEKATSWVTKGAEFVSINNKNFMLPTTAINDDTPDEIENRLLSLSEAQISLPAQTVDNLTKKDYLEIIKSEGGWVNSRDGQNLVLVDDKGLLVYDPQGNEIKISILELEAKKSNIDFDSLTLEEKIEQFNIMIDQYGNN